MIFHPGQLILNNKYRVEKLIGQGAYAEVFLAAHVELGVHRAIKALRADAPGVGSTVLGDYRQRFRLEFQLAARLDHPNVIKVYDLVEEPDAIYAVLEYAPGGSVADLLREGGPLPIDQAVQILLDCAQGLEALHERLDAIHRDVKPSNILLGEDGPAKIADLGLAQVAGGENSGRPQLGSQAGVHPGTMLYRSPEHNSWEPLRPTSDVYSLGCTAFEMLTGKAWKQAMVKVERVRELRPEVPEWLDAVVARMVSERPALRISEANDFSKRYLTMGRVLDALRCGSNSEDAHVAIAGSTGSETRDRARAVRANDPRPDPVRLDPDPGEPGRLPKADGGTGDAASAPATGGADRSPAGMRAAQAKPPSADGPAARFLLAFGSFGNGKGQFRNPSGLALDKSGNVYVADTDNHRVQKFSPDGRCLATWGSHGTGNGNFYSPRGVAVDVKGSIYVADQANNRVQKFSPRGALPFGGPRYAGQLPLPSDYDGRNFSLRAPFGIAVDGGDNVLVLHEIGNGVLNRGYDKGGDTANMYLGLYKFSPDGRYLSNGVVERNGYGTWQGVRFFPRGAKNPHQWRPTALAADPRGHVFVLDDGMCQVHQFGPAGEHIRSWAWEAKDRRFNEPLGIAVDHLGQVYVADTGNHRVQKFSPEGHLLLTWGSPGIDQGQFRYPGGVAVDRSGNVYVLDTGNHRVQKFRVQ